jgi:hypothetical protein
LAVPGLLGEANAFNRRYQNPITAGQDRDATDEEVAKGKERLTELLGLCGQYMLRRCVNSSTSGQATPPGSTTGRRNGLLKQAPHPSVETAAGGGSRYRVYALLFPLVPCSVS